MFLCDGLFTNHDATQQPRNYINVTVKTYKAMQGLKERPDESFEHLINRLIAAQLLPETLVLLQTQGPQITRHIDR